MSRQIQRRELLRGLAGTTLLASVPTSALARIQVPSAPLAPASFSVRSADGVVLMGETQGPSAASEILLIHGLRQSRLSWEKQTADPALARFRLVSFDLRGHGDSDKPEALDAYSDPERWADDVATVIRATGLRRPVLVGWSLGGWVIGAYLRKYGGSGIAGVNLVDAVTHLSPEALTPLAGEFTQTTISDDLAIRTKATADFLSVCFHQPPEPAAFQRMLVVNGMTARAVNEGFVQTTYTDLAPELQAYSGPILLTHGVHDRLVRVAASERIKAMQPRSRLSLYADSGHSPFYEEPARFGRELAAFMAASGG